VAAKGRHQAGFPTSSVMPSTAGSCPAASHCANDHDGVSLAVVIGLGALVLVAILLVKLGGLDKR
jgi:hypothetical protein